MNRRKRLQSICASCAVLLSASALAAAELPMPEHQWTFEEAVKGRIMPVRGNTPGVLQNGDGVSFVNGRFGKALDFGNTIQPNGTAVPTVFLTGLPVDFTKPFSVIVTMKLDRDACSGMAGYRAFKDVLGNCGTRGPGVRFSFFYGMFHVNSGDGKTASSVDSVAGITEIPLGRWFQAAFTYDGTELNIYCDGLQVASGKIALTASKATMRIGSHNGNAYNLPGAIDDIKIFTRALSQADIVEYYLDFAE